MTPRSSIPVLRFRAGALHLGIAAEDVLSVSAPTGDAPHIAGVLGIPPGADAFGRRNVHVVSQSTHTPRGLGGMVFQVDPPVDVIRCEIGDIVPTGASMTMAKNGPIMGFAHIDGVLITILDIPSVVATFLSSRGGRVL